MKGWKYLGTAGDSFQIFGNLTIKIQILPVISDKFNIYEIIFDKIEKVYSSDNSAETMTWLHSL